MLGRAAPTLAKNDMDKAEHQERGEPERYAAEHIDGGNGVAYRSRFGSLAEPGNIRHDPGDRSTERGTDRAHRGQGGGGTAIFVGADAVHRSGDEMHVVDADADAHHKGAQGHQREPRQ